MSSIVLLDTSIYLNILDVPGNNQHREDVMEEFKLRIEQGDSFLLPMAAIWETGNHIANLRDGSLRYKFATDFISDVKSALNGNTPYRPTFFPDNAVFGKWLNFFPDYAKRNTRVNGEGISLSDLTIIMEWEQTKARHRMSRVLIWARDRDLENYDTGNGQ
jgi:hypothetical protein